ncbi:MAG: hypothetical protein J7L14_03740 [Candidatus Diapherotrites archaeon]|nr:hypothetical protein [Candidatus Diapherotrites archaeon]
MPQIISVNSQIKAPKILLHETQKSVLFRFLLVFILVIAYFCFVVFHFGIKNGLWITFLTWSFFVFCTPIADAGLLLDFPVRLITGIRMLYSEICVWLFAAVLNLYTSLFNPQIYTKTKILSLFKYIITHPIPYWLIILLSGIGTFLSIYFGDELLDVVRHTQRSKFEKHKHKHRLIIILFLVAAIIVLYNFLINELC